jgi:hypothetical protein
MLFSRRIRRTRHGDFEIRLPAEERDLLANVAPQLRQLLDGDLADPGLRRLFPTAYAQDAERDREYHALVRDELADRRRAAVELLVSTVDADRLTEDELVAWMGAINDLRLVLGTRLDVGENDGPLLDEDDPEAPLAALYGYLGWLLEQVVDALSGALPEPRPDADAGPG